MERERNIVRSKEEVRFMVYAPLEDSLFHIYGKKA